MAEPSSEAQLEACKQAILHVLRTSQENPDLGYYISRGTQSFELLCQAEAAFTGAAVDAVKDHRARDLQPEYRRREPEVVELRVRNRKLQRAVDELLAVKDRQDSFDLAAAARRALRALDEVANGR